MTLHFDLVHAETAWLEASQDPRSFGRTLTVGPPGFEAYARVLTLPDPAHDGQEEADVADEVFDAAPVESDVVVETVELLAAGSGLDDLRFLMWDGYPYDPALPAVDRIDLMRLRSCAMATGSLADFRTWTTSGRERHFPPAFVWPTDRSWCVAYDVDSHFAGVAGTVDGIERVVAESKHPVVRDDRRVIPAMYH